MKRTLIALAITFGIVGCSTTSQPDTSKKQISEQHLVSTFKRNGVKIEWSCAWGTGFSETTCVRGHVTAIEATGYAPSYGASEANRETAFTVAHDVALDKLIRFIKQDISSSRVTNTLTKNIEKANDNIKRSLKTDGPVEADDSAEDNIGTRTNINESVRSVTESIRSNASGIVHGARTVDELIVDSRTVAVTVRWSKEYADQSIQLRSYFTK